MTDLSRRKLIVTGLAAAAGVSTLGVAAHLAQEYGLSRPITADFTALAKL